MAAGSLGFMLGWLGNFKLLAFAANRGPLALRGISPTQWLLMLLLPYFPAKRGHARTRTGNVLLSLVAKIAFAAALTVALISPAAAAFPVMAHVGYALYVWLFASMLLDAPAPLGVALLGGIVDLQPAMHAPYLATSVREFWGRRYNQIVSVMLQPPIMLGQEAVTSWLCGLARRRRAAGGPNRTAGSYGFGHLALRVLQTAVTLALVLASAERLFWGPFEACEIDKRGLAEAMGAIRVVRGLVERAGVLAQRE
ncbi:hypothetical protein GPECTOR_6g573 [Gonium pectorale]|uniref:Wax synthase domain-containing protein n=1 Tax=Gonium pectorale TaxID=33097 RepID=A0A150GUV2_GONPE|nr:hypothetical protein GPECTOR_6g573 [Gonium pectorale]|eukprot:KXZ53656.1 hypothetical protein GPECTOR_6g573 [Gonium pectorale]